FEEEIKRIEIQINNILEQIVEKTKELKELELLKQEAEAERLLEEKEEEDLSSAILDSSRIEETLIPDKRPRRPRRSLIQDQSDIQSVTDKSMIQQSTDSKQVEQLDST